MLISLCPVAALKHSPSKRKSVKIKPGGAGVTVPGVPGGQSSKTGSGDAGGGQDRSRNGSFLQVFNGKTKSFDWDTLYFHYPRDIPLKTNNLDHNAIVLIG